ncbi:MarR family transcriptional regulator [Novosphingobium sp. 1949]|uniref:MarR family transcriptional regulator n=1 Tax=Novosphingobium organovorum TaxID=2930092 RepID=A0ABT0BGU4_9SPHN|nr:MarR family transcriptional regulator [Novosphingobium organovorum]MCJ2184271.1 MarR family transcriptional regulator [Novosphingobium organovorum]
MRHEHEPVASGAKAVLTGALVAPGGEADASCEFHARRLRAASRALARAGLARAEGAISLRLGRDWMLMTPDLPPGLIGEGLPCQRLALEGPLPADAPPMAEHHRAIYRLCPQVGALLHAAPDRIMARTGEVAAQSPEAAARRLGTGTALSLGSRGWLFAGATVEEALARVWEVEEAARIEGVDIAARAGEPLTPSQITRAWQFCTAGDAEADAPAGGWEEPTDFDFWQSPGHLLRLCTQRGHDIFHDVLGEHLSVTRQQFAVLWAIRDNPRASQQRLTEITGWDRNTMSGMLSRLVDQGLIEKQRDAHDGRQHRVLLTPSGEAMLQGMVPDLLEVQRRVLEPLPPELRATFIQCARIMLGLPPV